MSVDDYREGITDKSPQISTKSKNGYNRIKMYMEPLDDTTMKLIHQGKVKIEQDSKERAKILSRKAGWNKKDACCIWEIYNDSVFIDGSHGLKRLDRIKMYCCGAFRDWLNMGVLSKEPVVGLKVIFVDATVHVNPANTGFSEIASMMFSGLTLCYLNAKPHLFERIKVLGNPQIVRYQRVPEQEEEGIIAKICIKKGIDREIQTGSDDLLANYHGTQLVESNARVLEELEWILVKPIPLEYCVDLGGVLNPDFMPKPKYPVIREGFGFTAKNKWVFTLNLYGQGIAGLPEYLDRLYNLKELILDFNHLGRLPDAITNLPCLQVLTVHSNWLTNLPPGIGKLKSLTYLDLSDNHLKALPSSLGELTRIEMLNLSDNPLSAVPAELANLPSLVALQLDQRLLNNPVIEKIRKKTKVYAGSTAAF